VSPHAHEPGIVDRAEPRWRALRDLIQARSVITGEFTLTSGRKSNYMFQLRETTMLPEGQYLIGTLILDVMKKLKLACISGLELGAVPLVTAVAFASYVEKYPVHASFVRKTAKSHGARERIDGEIPQGAEALVVDDVTTTGGSILKAAEAIKEERACIVKWALSIVDREEGAAENLARAGLSLIPLFRKGDFRID
jgi:orotate phosphoribosyltransferase